MIPITKTTISIPTHTPALNIPPTTAQLFKKIAVRIKRRVNNFFIFNKSIEISCQAIKISSLVVYRFISLKTIEKKFQKSEWEQHSIKLR